MKRFLPLLLAFAMPAAENVDDNHFVGTGLVKVISDEIFTIMILK